MTADILEESNAARIMCPPPQRGFDDQEALWQAISDGTIELVTSDHAPYRLDETGKYAHGKDAPFNKIAIGMPGLATRLEQMFDVMVSKGRQGIVKFVELSVTAPARAFGLTNKGQIAPGFDADIAIWDPELSRTYVANDLHDNVGYNPFGGTRVNGLPVTVLSHGQVLVDDGRYRGQPGRGSHIKMTVKL
jgi:dihydropyrimidinase